MSDTPDLVTLLTQALDGQAVDIAAHQAEAVLAVLVPAIRAQVAAEIRSRHPKYGDPRTYEWAIRVAEGTPPSTHYGGVDPSATVETRDVLWCDAK